MITFDCQNAIVREGVGRWSLVGTEADAPVSGSQGLAAGL
jgi:hypothetical protein